jgi:hypothetical protein
MPILALAALLAGTALPALGAGPVETQTAPVASPATPPRQAAPRTVEGRIAALKTELKITDEQAPQFERVAQAMRDNAKEIGQFRQQERAAVGQKRTALDILATRQRYDALRAAEAQRLLDAFTPLYASLTDVQRATADELLAPHPRRHG